MKKERNNRFKFTKDLHGKLKLFYEIMSKGNIGILQITSKNYNIYIKRKDISIQNKIANIEQTLNLEKISGNINVANKTEPQEIKETIKSPIVGTFYKAPSPTLPPFVNEGDVVEGGTVICLIEAMKVINEIKTSFKLKIIKLLVDNGQAVNSGQDLFEIEKIN
jgi:acetyl-CoA carboxylase biotin carboxyl carrier protein